VIIKSRRFEDHLDLRLLLFEIYIILYGIVGQYEVLPEVLKSMRQLRIAWFISNYCSFA